jgi:argininosuccinate lyase
VQRAEAADCDLSDLPLAEMQAVEPRITSEIYQVLTVESSVASRTSHGGTAPDCVRAAAAEARNRFL